MRLRPAWFRHDLLTLFDLLQQKKIKPLIACLSAKRGTHTSYWQREASLARSC
jgi:hypothetical protein